MTPPPPDSDASPQPRWGIGDLAIAVGLTVFLGTLIAAVTKPATDAGGPAGAWSIVALLTVPWLGLAGWPLFVSWRKGNGPRSDYALSLTWRDAGVGVAGGLVALVLASLVQVITEKVIGHGFNSAVGDLAGTVADSRAALIVFTLCVAVGAPVVEEIAFRGLLFGAFRKFGLAVGPSVVYTAVLFALFHLEVVRLPLLLVIGLVLTGVRAVTGSTGASIVTHMCVNLPGALAILFLGS